MASSSQAPISSNDPIQGSEWPIPIRIAVCLLKAIAADRTSRFNGYRPTSEAIATLLGMNKRAVDSVYSDAKKRGFNPQAYPLRLESSFFESASRSGRPTKMTAENETAITQIVTRDKQTR